MVMNYEKVSKGLPTEEAAKYATGIDLVNAFVRSLKGQNLLPKEFSRIKAETVLKTPEAALEIPPVSEEIYIRTREVVEATGYNFVVAIRQVSIEDLLAEDGQRESRRFGYVNDSKTMRTTVSPEMEIAINPDRFRIEGSNNLSTDKQKDKIKEEEARWKEQLPEDLRTLVGMYMVDPSALSQLEDVYMDKNGKLLFPDYFARTDVRGVSGTVAVVGRGAPTDRRGVIVWDRGVGYRRVFAVSVVVLPRKLAV